MVLMGGATERHPQRRARPRLRRRSGSTPAGMWGGVTRAVAQDQRPAARPRPRPRGVDPASSTSRAARACSSCPSASSTTWPRPSPALLAGPPPVPSPPPRTPSRRALAPGRPACRGPPVAARAAVGAPPARRSPRPTGPADAPPADRPQRHPDDDGHRHRRLHRPGREPGRPPVDHRAARSHNDLVRAEVDRHGGTEVKAQGDGFLVVFPSARRAILAAIDVQRAGAAMRRAPRRRRCGCASACTPARSSTWTATSSARTSIVAVRIADQRPTRARSSVSGLTRDLTAVGRRHRRSTPAPRSSSRACRSRGGCTG